MGILGGLKNRLLRRSEPELEDIRSHVLGEPAARDVFSPEPAEPFAEPREPEPFMPRQPMQFEPEFGRPIATEQKKDYEILDRLNMIEAQLSAIRSQAETINERLKNMEMRMGRRY